MKQYRKKPVVVNTLTFTELLNIGLDDQDAVLVDGMPITVNLKISLPPEDDEDELIRHHALRLAENGMDYYIPTLEGYLRMTPDDILIIGVHGEVYPCKKDIFEKTYEEV